MCGDADQVLAPMQDDLPDRYLLGFGERVAQHGIAPVGFVTVRQAAASEQTCTAFVLIVGKLSQVEL